MKIDWIVFSNKLLKKAIFPKNYCYGRDDDHDDKMVNPFSRKPQYIESQSKRHIKLQNDVRLKKFRRFVNWPIKVIIVDISKTMKDIIKIQTAYKT